MKTPKVSDKHLVKLCWDYRVSVVFFWTCQEKWAASWQAISGTSFRGESVPVCLLRCYLRFNDASLTWSQFKKEELTNELYTTNKTCLTCPLLNTVLLHISSPEHVSLIDTWSALICLTSVFTLSNAVACVTFAPALKLKHHSERDTVYLKHSL